MNKICEMYNSECARPSDINEHLPVLKKYSELCDHVTEMGVRGIVSTWAFLAGQQTHDRGPSKLVSYDFEPPARWDGDINQVYSAAKEADIDFTFIQQDVLEVQIEETDLLFIDTWHEYEQLKQELKLHADKAKKYIILHDTTAYAHSAEVCLLQKRRGGEGVWPAIEEFLNENEDWKLQERFTNNNGLTVLARTVYVK